MTVTEPVMPSLSLEEWRAIMQIHPYHFWQLADATTPGLRITSAASVPYMQYTWQASECIGRNDIVNAIRSAERMLLSTLNYRPGPQYVEATVPWPRLAQQQFVRSGPWDMSGRWLSLDLPENEIIAIGVEARTSIGTANLVYSDNDGDGVVDTATATIATSVTDTTQIGVYVPAAERLNSDPVSEVYRIRPVSVQISGGIATIRIPAWLCVRPIRYEGLAPQALDPAAAGVLLQSVEVYQRTTNQDSTAVATAGAVIVWETRPVHGWWCGCGCQSATAYNGSPYDPAAIAQAVARVALRNARLGQVAAAQAAYDSTTGAWAALDWSVCQEPDQVIVRYLAGVPSPDGQRMSREWATVVARLAAAEITQPINAKQPSQKEIARWQFDRSRTAGANDEMYTISPDDLNNPFGTRAGHIQAWKYVQDVYRTRGIAAG